MKKVIIAISLITVILCYNSITFADELTDLIQKQNELQNQKNDADSKLGIVQEELSANLQQVENLSQSMSEYQIQIDEWGKQIETLNSSIKEIQEKLDIAQKDYDEQEKLLESRLVTMYEAGDTSFLDFILSSNNIVDFISNYYLMAELTTYDEDLLDKIEREKSEIEQNKKMLETQQSEYNTIKANYEKKKIILYNTKALKDEAASKLTEEEKTLSEQIDEYRNQILAVEAEIAQVTKANIDTEYIGGEMAWPVPGYTRITSNYGMRTHPITGIYKLHTGVDLGAPMGANFIAANDGVVTKAGYNGAYGNMVIIDHGGGISTLYAHGSEILVTVGQTVKKGDNILKVGSTGYSTGAHAHFEVRVNGQPVNPLPYITSNTKTEEINNNTED